MSLPFSVYTGPLWRYEFYAGSWVSWEKLEPKRAPYLPASYVPSLQSIYWTYPSFGSASSWKPTLAGTNFTMLICEALNHLKLNPYKIQQRNCWRRISTTSWPELTPTPPSSMSSMLLPCMKMWDTTLDYRAGGTQSTKQLHCRFVIVLFMLLIVPCNSTYYMYIINMKYFMDISMQRLHNGKLAQMANITDLLREKGWQTRTGDGNKDNK